MVRERDLRMSFGNLRGNDPVEAQVIAAINRSRQSLDGHVSPLADVDLTGSDLGEVDLNSLEILNCRFDQCQLRGSDFSGAVLDECSFVEADLSMAFLWKVQLSQCDFRSTNLLGANLGRSDVFKCDFRGADMSSGPRLRNGEFTHETGFMKASFYHCDLRGAKVKDTRWDKGSLGDCLVAGADFSGANGSMLPLPINVGTREQPEILSGDEALRWFHDAGGRDLVWFAPNEPRTSG